jgi:hypothetical protein
MRSKRLNHLSISNYLRMTLIELTPFMLLYDHVCGMEERENLGQTQKPKGLLVQLKIWIQTPV